jgi:hypothetical protein
MELRSSIDPAMRGYRILYRAGVTNYCPGCGHAHWYVGREVAECAFCTTVLPLSERQGSRTEFALVG